MKKENKAQRYGNSKHKHCKHVLSHPCMCKVPTEVDHYEVGLKGMDQYLLKIRVRSYDLKKEKQN